MRDEKQDVSDMFMFPKFFSNPLFQLSPFILPVMYGSKWFK
jgi:hypothetical protein